MRLAITTRSLIVAAALLATPAARADEATIGFLTTQPQATRPSPGSLERELVARGRIGNGKLRFEYRFAEGDAARLDGLARELIATKPIVLFCGDFFATRAAAAASSAVPIVFAAHVDPIEHKFLSTLRSSQRNLTGVVTFRPVLAKMAEIAIDAFPRSRTVTALLDLDELAVEHAIHSVRSVIERDRRRLRVQNVSTVAGLDAFIAHLARGGDEVVLVPSSSATWQNRERLVAAINAHAIPAVYESEIFVQAGGLMSYGPSYSDVVPRLVDYVERVAGGTHPQDLPILQPTKTEFIVNLRAARAQGISLSKRLLQRADQILE